MSASPTRPPYAIHPGNEARLWQIDRGDARLGQLRVERRELEEVYAPTLSTVSFPGDFSGDQYAVRSGCTPVKNINSRHRLPAKLLHGDGSESKSTIVVRDV